MFNDLENAMYNIAKKSHKKGVILGMKVVLQLLEDPLTEVLFQHKDGYYVIDMLKDVISDKIEDELSNSDGE